MSVFMKHKNTIVPSLFLAVVVATVVTKMCVNAGVVESIIYRDYSAYLPVFTVFYIVAVAINAMYLTKINQFKPIATTLIVITSVILWSTPLIIYKY